MIIYYNFSLLFFHNDFDFSADYDYEFECVSRNRAIHNASQHTYRGSVFMFAAIQSLRIWWALIWLLVYAQNLFNALIIICWHTFNESTTDPSIPRGEQNTREINRNRRHINMNKWIDIFARKTWEAIATVITYLACARARANVSKSYLIRDFIQLNCDDVPSPIA